MLDANGSVWSVGYNGSGQFGLNNTSNYYLPQKNVIRRWKQNINKY